MHCFNSVTRKKLPKNDFSRKRMDFDTLEKLPKNVGDLAKLRIAKGFKNYPKVLSIAQSGHTDCLCNSNHNVDQFYPAAGTVR